MHCVCALSHGAWVLLRFTPARSRLDLTVTLTLTLIASHLQALDKIPRISLTRMHYHTPSPAPAPAPARISLTRMHHPALHAGVELGENYASR